MLPLRSTWLHWSGHWRLLGTPPVRRRSWRGVLQRSIPDDRSRPGQIRSDLHVTPRQNSDLPWRLFARVGLGLVVLCAGCHLIGSSCFAAGDASGPTPEMPAADHATEALLRTIMQQISDGRIISPSDDNAMQTWQRVLQRDIATQGSPEVLKALEDFDTYARKRAADEKAAGRLLVAAELTVFADQASRMTGRIAHLDSPGTSDTAGSGTPPPGQSGSGSAAPAGATGSESPPARSAAAAIGATSPDPAAGATASGTISIAPASASAGRAIAVPDAEVPDARPAHAAAKATEAADDTVPAARPIGGIASVTRAVMHMAPQTFGTTPIAVDTTGGDGSPARAGNATEGAAPREAYAAAEAPTPASGAAPQASSDTPQAPATSGDAARTQSTDNAAPAQVIATGEAIRAPSPGVTILAGAPASGNAGQVASTGTTAAASEVVPFDRLSGQLRAEAHGAAEPGSRGSKVAETLSTAVPVAGGAPTTAMQPAPGAGNAVSTANGAPQPAAPESAMAAFYAARGDAMLDHRDISAARKFYEFAANAGSARAAVALARTYDPAFTAQLGEVGLRPDPGLAAVWYRKAAELGGSPALLSQSSDTGK
jgi:hypothetical protein